MTKLKICIVTHGRFHVLDLARELNNLGHDVAFWSCLPKKRAMRFGLPVGAFRNLFPIIWPLIVLQRYSSGRFRRSVDLVLTILVDYLVAFLIEPCDIFIGMSGICVESAKSAQEKYGALTFIERGRMHILSQRQILEAIEVKGEGRRNKKIIDTVSDITVTREQIGYQLATRIVVPSQHAKISFEEQGMDADQIFKNPYGVDLNMFSPTAVNEDLPPTIIYVGNWTYQKGVDILVDVWKSIGNVKLLHVGSVGDAPIPLSSNLFEHVNSVPQWNLVKYYSQAHLLVLASRHDGFGVVLAQALACGLPIVCSDRTGGKDLKELLPSNAGDITIVPHENAEALAEAIKKTLALSFKSNGKRDLLGISGRKTLSWKAYADRYDREIQRLFRIKNNS